jgi:type II secretory pathway component PulF
VLSLKKRAAFCRALADQLAAGVDPLTAANTAAAVVPSRRKPDTERLVAALARGEPFSRALGEAALLPGPDLALIAVGERSGALAEVLRELADLAEETLALRRHILAGLALPAFNLLSACFILPLPALVLGGSLARYLASVLTPPILFTVLGFGLVRLARGTSGAALDRWLRPLPGAGRIWHELECWRFFRTLALLTRTNLGMVDSVAFAAGVCRGSKMRDGLAAAAAEAGARGAPVGPLVARTHLLPADVVAEWRTAEQTGRLEETFRRISANYGESCKERLRSVAGWVPRIVYFVVLIFMALQVLRLAGAYLGAANRIMGG